jgi:uncharacterized protein YcsI (UPF0317 family)
VLRTERRCHERGQSSPRSSTNREMSFDDLELIGRYDQHERPSAIPDDVDLMPSRIATVTTDANDRSGLADRDRIRVFVHGDQADAVTAAGRFCHWLVLLLANRSGCSFQLGRDMVEEGRVVIRLDLVARRSGRATTVPWQT